MNFSRWKSIDPHLLVGLVNTELRNHSESIEDFLRTHDIEEDELIGRLREAGYEFQPDQKRFR